MQYRNFADKKLSLLGFGAMRLPKNDDGTIDYEKTEALLDCAMEAGINYYDTAYPYHSGYSEKVVGEILSKYPRESYYLATKYPGHQVMSEYNPAEIFEEQLQKCGVDYFDFYLLHNVNESSIGTYLDKRWGIIDYFVEQKRLGRIHHLGFSTHGMPENIEEFLSVAGEHMEFCQIQLNYLDYTLQRANEKCRILNEHGIPIWVMESVRGGKLADGLPEAAKERLRALRPSESPASFGFRWLAGIEGVTVVLSGMTTMEQLLDNIKTYSGGEPLSSEEFAVLLDIAEGLKRSLPCTSCRYCTDVCPMGLDIPILIEVYNDVRVAASVNAGVRIEFMPEDKRPTACIGCGACAAICPQKIDIPNELAAFSAALEKIPSWRKISADREEAARKLREK
ncbi:MAG: aldo/keto reductase [Clostridia bacterium]|nr:aldo/keto reductase [Clostridia bacterium]